MLMLVLALAAAMCSVALGHARLVCPPPRSPDTGAKLGPCGHPDDPTVEPLVLEPGLNTIVWEESVYHYAAPARLALSTGTIAGDEAGTFEQCVLLDHIPHGDAGLPKDMVFSDPSTYVPYAVSIIIPNIRCTRCQLQLVSLMTDAIHGVAPGTDCALFGESIALSGKKPACPMVYHSCAPVSIKGDPENDLGVCDPAATDRKLNWPFNLQPGVYFFEGDEGNWTGNFPNPPGFNATQALPEYAKRRGPCANVAPEVRRDPVPPLEN